MSLGPFQAMAWVAVAERLTDLWSRWRDRRALRMQDKQNRKEQEDIDEAVAGTTE